MSKVKQKANPYNLITFLNYVYIYVLNFDSDRKNLITFTKTNLNQTVVVLISNPSTEPCRPAGLSNAVASCYGKNKNKRTPSPRQRAHCDRDRSAFKRAYNYRRL
ncbi:hypothetical protein J6590_058287 [Homalodisca vitripennis]|nr:hypothetical protein J6590_058287 [Homalodisca vitripennis]